MNNLLEKYGFSSEEMAELGLRVYTIEEIRAKTSAPHAYKMGSFVGPGPAVTPGFCSNTKLEVDDDAHMDITCVCSLNLGEVLCSQAS